MILSVSHVKKAFLEDEVLKEASFHIEDRGRVGLVGVNGAGKSTLFKIIAGLMEPDSGLVTLQKDRTMGYLAQHEELSSNEAVLAEVLSTRRDVFETEQRMRDLEHAMKDASGEALENLLRQHSALQEAFEKENGYAVESEAVGVLKGLGFTEESFTLPMNVLSGGEKTRVALARLLLTKPDLLLLDEPTNHLDIHAMEWLETYLMNYPGAVFVISHDRYFLDRTVRVIIDLTQGVTSVYQGNYSEFIVKKRAVWTARIREYEKQQREIRHQEEVIAKLRSFNREKSIKRAQSREHLLERMERIEKPTEERDEMILRLTPNVTSGNDVLMIEDLAKSFSGRTLFSDVNIDVKRGEHIALIGDNGTGKTTLLRIIAGQERADRGSLTFGTNVFVAYFDQEHMDLHPEKSIFSEIQDEHPAMNNTEIRNMLAAFLFTGDDVYKRVGELSGGEQSRVALAKLMLSDANLLILDEPTNHLDMTSREILENAVISYEGTVICVSHDRYFINRTADRILELYGGRFLNYIGNYDYYTEKNELFHTLFAEKEEKKSGVSEGSLDWKLKKEEDARKRKAENELKRAEQAVTDLEDKIRVLDETMADPANATDAEKLIALQKEKTMAEEALTEALALWEELMQNM
ncbi:MAG: ABC-F family ATP-binding cassette domain-containing protein [Lachnospiraceae bacterium]|nr:ABC-F family ATP-binding cassette domain-containing protein [Lachnospiraceae bacterium]